MSALHHNDDNPCPLCEAKLSTAHSVIADWFRKIKAIWKNVHVSWAFRNKEQQERVYEDGASLVRWPNSAHNYMIGDKPQSLALDIFQIDDDGVARFSPKFYRLIWDWTNGGDFKLRWGGDFKKLGDAGHYELLKESL